MRVELSIALTDNERTRPILDGTVSAEGVTLVPSALEPGELFWRQLKFAEFDVSEMSLASLLIAASHGPLDWVALPVFPWREFFHTTMRVRSDSSVTSPAQLRGRRVGVKEYQQTAALWTRAAMLHEFGVAPQDVEWFMERGAGKSHGGATAFQPPAGVRFSYIPPERNLGAMLIDGEIDALTFYLPATNALDRSIVLDGNAQVRWLFPDPLAEGVRYYRKTGIFPINHCVVVRKSLAERFPWLPLNLYAMFVAAKERAARRTLSGLTQFVRTGVLDPAARQALERDPIAYGFAANAAVLEAIVTYLQEQGLTSRTVSLGEVFCPSTIAA